MAKASAVPLDDSIAACLAAFVYHWPKHEVRSSNRGCENYIQEILICLTLTGHAPDFLPPGKLGPMQFGTAVDELGREEYARRFARHGDGDKVCRNRNS